MMKLLLLMCSLIINLLLILRLDYRLCLNYVSIMFFLLIIVSFYMFMRYKNNPANIRYLRSNQWLGQIEPKNGFCQFSTMDHGLRALVIILRRYIKKGYDTPEKIVYRFCPPLDPTGKNDTCLYLRLVCDSLHIESDCPILYGSNMFLFLCVKICQIESNTILGAYDIQCIIKKFKL